ADLVHVIDEAFAARGGGDALGNAFVAVGRPEFGGKVLLARNALARDPVIQEIGPPVQFDRHVRLERQRLFEATLANETPWADDIGDDIDAQGLLLRHGGLLWPGA